MTVRTSIRRGVAELVLDRPDLLNAFDGDDVRALRAAITEVRDDRDARVAILRGEGRAFSAGAHRDQLDALQQTDRSTATEIVRAGVELILELVELPVPTVAAVQGACYGGAVSLALACDHVVAADDVTFGLVFTRLGLPGGDMLATWVLARRVGTRRAFHLLATGATLDAEAALSLGLVDAVVPRSELEERARAVATGYAAGPAAAIATTKHEILHLEGGAAGIRRQAELEIRRLVDAVAGEEFAIGRRAAEEGQDPDFGAVSRPVPGDG